MSFECSTIGHPYTGPSQTQSGRQCVMLLAHEPGGGGGVFFWENFLFFLGKIFRQNLKWGGGRFCLETRYVNLMTSFASQFTDVVMDNVYSIVVVSDILRNEK